MTLRPVNALSLGPAARAWLAGSGHVRILHVFDRACNLIDERREVLSVVTQQIGNGPFNLLVEGEASFLKHLNAQSPIFIRGTRLQLGDFTIETFSAKPWSARPDWNALHARKEDILNQVRSLPAVTHPPKISESLLMPLCTAVATADSSSLPAARGLAGLGQGLTPAGDDFILGAVLAAWILHPAEVARTLAEEITQAAAALTASLSAAWLRSAGRGEAGIQWQCFFDALISGDARAVQESARRLLAVGHTSGADALAGFTSTFVAVAEVSAAPCPS